MNDAIKGERTSLIFRDEKSIRTRRRFNCVKTNIERIEVCALRRRECFYEYEMDYVRRLVKRRTMIVARFLKFANYITLILQQGSKNDYIIPRLYHPTISSVSIR